ncbi:MAG: protealysin inhibitor emfourin [Anaerolineae bacterium]
MNRQILKTSRLVLLGAILLTACGGSVAESDTDELADVFTAEIVAEKPQPTNEPTSQPVAAEIPETEAADTAVTPPELDAAVEAGNPAAIAITSELVITLHRSGGFAGLDETWQIGTDGWLRDEQNEALGRVSDQTLVALAAQVDQADFFNLAPDYLPKDTCCDRFFYTVTVNDGSRTHSVNTMDDADAPDALWTLISGIMTAVNETPSPTK